uniref:Ubinuclein 2b n=1 Tax=Neogobius melanostomus TaxID=47308 RepID=A0A8C6ULA0_9GOBI
MAEPRKVPFVTISSFSTVPQTPEPGKKRRREEDGTDITFGKDGGGSAAGTGSGGGAAQFGDTKGGESDESKPTLRLNLSLSEPSERGSAEFNYSELTNSTHSQEKAACSTVPKGLAPSLDPSDPFADDDKERREVEELAKKFESKYVTKKKKKDRMQDLIDIGFGYDETDPFIDNSEAYDELVPASLTTKHGGFYINTGTLQFRAASDTEGEETSTAENHFKSVLFVQKMKDGEERVIKKRRKKQDAGALEEKKPRKNKVPKSGVSALNAHRPEKKKRKKLMKDSLHLANMLRRFNREKEEMRKKNPTGGLQQRPNTKLPAPNSSLITNQSKPNNDCSMADLSADPVVMSLLGTANNDILQDMMGDLDFGLLDSPHSPGQGENGSFGHKGRVSQGNVTTPPLPNGLPAPLAKRIEDLRAASRQFDEEGRKKFFTLDMNNILLDIELQVQEQPTDVRAAIYSHLEAFVPCNKEALLKRLKKLNLNIQDDRLRTPLLKLKLAVCSVMPEQISRYNMDCMAKVAKQQQQEEGEKNGSDDDDEEKPGKRVMGPRKKFVWDDKLRTLLCNLVRIKLNCYELEGKNSMSLEDYLKAFMENEVKPLWPKGWMQARMLFKESTLVHGHLTVIWTPRSTSSAAPTPSPVARRLPQSPTEPICLDSLDDDLASPSLDSISHALAILGNAAKGLAQGESPPSPEAPKPPPSLHSSPVLQQQKKNSVNSTSISTPHYLSTSTSSPLSRPTSISASPLATGRVPGVDTLSKNSPQVHRHSVLNSQRPMSVGVAKANMSATVSSPKPRPPATASPLMVPSGLLKGSSSKGSDTVLLSSPQTRPHMLQSGSPHLTPKPYIPPRLPHTPSTTPSQPQSNFITPMHATLTKPSHSSIAPIIKLSSRAPSPAVSGSSSPALSQPPRSQVTPSIHQYSPKSPASFRASFSGSPGAAAKPGPGIFTVPGQKTPSSTTTSSLINSSPMNKHTTASITAASVSHRPRPGISQGVKPILQGVKPIPQGVKPIPQGGSSQSHKGPNLSRQPPVHLK